ncbi:MAG: 4Fe-4S binding protein [Smithellaceae bacterium]|nr:4Fe-4S binding protein [Smithellaceae bacterium]
MNPLRYGPNKTIVKVALRLSWPIMIAAKKLSNYPVAKWFINPFFAYPYNEVTAIPIQVELQAPDSVALPGQVVEHIIRRTSDIFILDECICRVKMSCSNHPQKIGCMALGKGVDRMHPSHGRRATADEALEHVEKAAAAGLVANVAHVWIDPLAFGLTRFSKLMFICFCDDCCCLYRTHMRERGPNLDKAYKKLPGVSISVADEKCNGCGICAQRCFAAAIDMESGKAMIGDSCKGCGRCVEVCPERALSLHMDEQDKIIEQIMNRIEMVADIT